MNISESKAFHATLRFSSQTIEPVTDDLGELEDNLQLKLLNEKIEDDFLFEEEQAAIQKQQVQDAIAFINTESFGLFGKPETAVAVKDVFRLLVEETEVDKMTSDTFQSMLVNKKGLAKIAFSYLKKPKIAWEMLYIPENYIQKRFSERKKAGLELTLLHLAKTNRMSQDLRYITTYNAAKFGIPDLLETTFFQKKVYYRLTDFGWMVAYHMGLFPYEPSTQF